MSGSSSMSMSETRIEALSIQSSAYGVTVPLVYGLARIAGNMLWYGGFQALPHTQTQGGKGGGVKTQSTSYTYTASVMMGLCEGGIVGVPRAWKGKKLFTGGWLPTQLSIASESYTVPSSGPMVFTVAHAATFTGPGLVRLSAGSLQCLAPDQDYSCVSGVYTIRNEALRGRTVQVLYQYATGTQPATALQKLGLSFMAGSLGQSTWSHLSTSYPAQAIGYSGLALVYAQDYDLGSGAQVENHTFEVQGPLAYSISTSVPDANPATVTADVLISGRYGAAFPPERLDSGQAWATYCLAANLLMSPALEEQMQAAELVAAMGRLTNTAPVWSGGVLKMVPYGDTTITGNGATYTPDLTPVYDLTDDDFLTSSDDDDPIKVTRKPQADAKNHVRVEFRNRGAWDGTAGVFLGGYNVEIAEAKDSANIDQYGLRSADVVRAHWICDAGIARSVAQLLLQRSLYVRSTYEFALPWTKALLEPMDLVTLTDGALFTRRPVRITEISEDDGGALRVTAEDFPATIATATVYPNQAGAGYQHNYNAAPGDVDAPMIWEAPADLAGTTGLEVYVAVRGSGADWGGCQVWVSLDGTSYQLMATVYGGARYGTLSASAAGGSATIAVQGLGSAQLLAASSTDAAALATLCYVGGANPEYLAYETATLTALGAYTLGGLVHAAYATAAGAHASGAPFARVDDRIAKSGPLDTSYVGQTISFKFLSFNRYGAAAQNPADVSPYTYTVTGDMAGLRLGVAGKGLALQADSLTFQYPKAGGVNPASVTLTAERKGALVGTVAWSVTAGTATLTGSGDTRTLTAANLTTDTATIRARITDAVGVYDAQVTISKVREGADGADGVDGTDGADGADAISSGLSLAALVLVSDTAGTVSSYSGAATTITVLKGNADDTSNWTISRTDGTGVTSSVSGATVTVSAMTTDTGYVDVIATRSGYPTQTRRFALSKSKTLLAPGVVAVINEYADDFQVYTGSPITATATLELYTTGLWGSGNRWYQPGSPPTTSFWIRATVLTGSTPSGDALNSWVQINTTRGWSLSRSAPSPGVGTTRCVLQIAIATDSAGATIVGSGTAVLEATIDI